jgi:AP-3 complex subunit delta-1
VKSTDVRTKALALEKLTYLHMLGYDMSWAAFHVVEVCARRCVAPAPALVVACPPFLTPSPLFQAMSSQKLRFKHIGYQAATSSLHPGLDVMLLIPNLLKKDLASPQQAEAGLAIDCLANLVTPELAATLVADCYALLHSPRTAVRRKAALALYKCFLTYPESLRPSFGRLTERLEDDDPGVVSAVVSVLCELATHNPRTYLPLAPSLYRLLQASSNNWMTIKLLKIFGALAPLEPRLGRKLHDLLAHIMTTTGAKSVLFECIRCVVGGMTQQLGLVQLAVEKLADFVGESDPNLRYLGLTALKALLGEHPKAVAYHRATIFACLEASDSVIQMQALDLVAGLVTRRSLAETVVRLMEHMRSAEQPLRDALVAAVLSMCSRDRYALLYEFGWYLAVLAELARVPGTQHGGAIAKQLVDVAVRVEAVQPDAVRLVRPLLLDPALLEPRADNATVGDALRAVAWITGEYACYLAQPSEALEALLQPSVAALPAATQAVYVHATLKVLISAARPCMKTTASAALEKRQAADAPGDEAGQHDAADSTSAAEDRADGDAVIAAIDEATASAAPGPGAAAVAAAAAAAAAHQKAEAAADDAADAAARVAAAQAEAAWRAPDLRGASSDEELCSMRALMATNLGALARSTHLEVRERACQVLAILHLLDGVQASSGLDAVRSMLVGMQAVSAAELLPVSSKAQRKVAPPPGLDLQAPMPWELERAEKRQRRALAAAAAAAAAPAIDAAVGSRSRKEALLAQASDGAGAAGDDSDEEDGEEGRGSRGGMLLKRKTKAERERDNALARAAQQAHRDRNSMFYIGGKAPGGGEEEVMYQEQHGGGAEGDGDDAESPYAAQHAPPRALPSWAALGGGGKPKAERAAVRRGGSDDEDEDGGFHLHSATKAKAYAPVSSIEAQHAGLQGVDLLSPLEGGEALPMAQAYPRAQAPMAAHWGGGGHQQFDAHMQPHPESQPGAPDQGERRERREKSKKHKEHKERGEDDAAERERRRERKERKAAAAAAAEGGAR